MKRLGLLLSIALCLSTAAMFAGCTSSPATTDTHDHDEHGHEDHGHGEEGHDHDHEHSHAGPHGGKVFVIGDEEYHGEWTHDESGKVTIYLLDGAVKEPVAIAAPIVEVDVKIGDMTKSYELAAVNPTADEPPTAHQFEIVDAALLGSLQAVSKDGVQATLKLVIAGKPYIAKIEEHDHGHDH